MSMAIEGFWTALELSAPEKNRAPVATPTARNIVAAETMVRNFIPTLPLWAVPLITYPASAGGWRLNQPVAGYEAVILASLCKPSGCVNPFWGYKTIYFRHNFFRDRRRLRVRLA